MHRVSQCEWDHVTANNPTIDDVMFFFGSDFRIVFYNNY